MTTYDIVSTLNTELRPILGDEKDQTYLVHRAGLFVLRRRDPMSCYPAQTLAVGDTLEDLVENYARRAT